MIVNLLSVVNGPLSQKFSVTHPTTNDWSDGSSPATNRGVINPADMDAARFLPEGTRLSESVEIYAAKALAFGDVITWHKQFYRVIHFQDYSDYGYYYGVAILTNEPANPDQPGFIDV